MPTVSGDDEVVQYGYAGHDENDGHDGWRDGREQTLKIMSDFDKPMGTCCCVPPAPGLRLLTFPDGTQSGVFGLDEAFAAVYAKGSRFIRTLPKK